MAEEQVLHSGGMGVQRFQQRLRTMEADVPKMGESGIEGRVVDKDHYWYFRRLGQFGGQPVEALCAIFATDGCWFVAVEKSNRSLPSNGVSEDCTKPRESIGASGNTRWKQVRSSWLPKSKRNSQGSGASVSRSSR
nr:hypothetical protein [Halomonas populi]